MQTCRQDRAPWERKLRAEKRIMGSLEKHVTSRDANPRRTLADAHVGGTSVSNGTGLQFLAEFHPVFV